MRGLSVVLLEARDFAAGTSSRSSKLVHGGIRYLAQGDMALVREAALERKTVRDIAPHLARRTLFIVPARNRAADRDVPDGSVDLRKTRQRRSRRSAPTVEHEAPRAGRTGARSRTTSSGAIVYPEYVTDDGRLTLGNVAQRSRATAQSSRTTPK